MRSNLIDPGHKILRFPHEIAMLKDAQIPPVLNVEVDLSETCNANCRACDFPSHYPSILEPATEQAMIHQLKMWGTRAVVFTGGGEPTTHPKWHDIANRWSQHFELGMYTNGINLDLSACPRAFRWVYVSVDAYDPESWAQYKRVSPDLFYKVMANIEAASLYTTIGVGFLIGEDNVDDILKMAILGAGTSAAYTHFRPRYPCNSNAWAPKARSLLSQAQGIPNVQVPWDKFEDAWNWQRPYRLCWASMFIRAMDTEGNVYPCPTMRGLRKIGDLKNFVPLTRPIPVTASCREFCRGHAMNKTLEAVMTSAPHDAFV